MKNRRAIFSAITSLTMFTLAILACGDDDSASTFKPSAQPDGSSSFDTGAGFNTDAKQEQKDAAVSCKPALPTTFAPTFKAPTAQAACEYQQITDYYAHCLANDDKGNAKLKSTECSDWKAAAANTTCAHCIETDDNSGPVQIYNDRLYYLFNTAGCIALKQKVGTLGSCAEKYDTATSCRRESCKTCLDQTGANFNNFIDCEKATLNSGGDCVKYQNESNETCQTSGYKDAGSSNSAVECFGTSPTQPQGDIFVSVGKVFCGKP
jgi:hypothetical protein